MANTVWRGQLTFGVVSFPVRLVRAARKDRIPLRYVREVKASESAEEGGDAFFPPGTRACELGHDGAHETVAAPVRQAYITDDRGAGEEENPVTARELQRGYEVAPGQFAVVRSEELRQLRQPTSSAMEILRSVHMDEIDPVFLETSYYVLPGNGGEHSYGLFYRALEESGYAALAEVAMHGRQHVVVIRAGAKGLIAHTMYYVNEVRGAEEHATETTDVTPKELDLAKRFVDAIAAPFRPEEFTDRYREELESLIKSKEAVRTRGPAHAVEPAAGNVVNIMEALRKSLEQAEAQKAARKPVTPAVAPAKTSKRRA